MILTKKNGQLIPVGLTLGKGIKKEKWSRPVDWLPIPEFDSEKDEVYILVGVSLGDINPIYFDAQMKSGTGTIDWGDGSPTETITTSNKTFNHNWSYEDTPDSSYTKNNETKQAIIHISCDRNTFKGIDFGKRYYYTNADGKQSEISKSNIYEVQGNCSQIDKLVMRTSDNMEIFGWSGNINIPNMTGMFSPCRALKTISLSDTSNITNMSKMCQYCYSLETIFLSDTSNVTDMSFMFEKCYSLETIPLLNTSNVTNMSCMFRDCYSLRTIPLLNTSKVTNMSHMFSSCYSLETIPLLNTSNVTTMENMFYYCYSLRTIPLLNTSKVKNMKSMFYYCYSLETIPLLNTSDVTTMETMFTSCHSLETIPLLNTSKVTNMTRMFSTCNSLRTITLLNTSKVTTMERMFSTCPVLQSVYLHNTSNLTNPQEMFQECAMLKTVFLSDTSKVTNMTRMFYRCSCLQRILRLDTRNTITWWWTIDGCHSLTRIPQLDLSNATSCDGFTNGSLVQNPILYNVGASSATSMYTGISTSTMTKQQLVDLFNSVAIKPDGTTRTLTLGSTLQGYLTNCYVKDSGVLDTYILPTRDTTIVSGKTYYTYDDITGEYTQVTPDFTTDTFYYELVTATWNKYVICESTDAGAMLALDYIRNIKGWTVT